MCQYPTNRSIRDDEQGFGTIVIAVVFIVVISLLTLGFAQLSRREQSDALDKQLAIQAQYAAQSGINDAEADIQNGYITVDGTANSLTPPGVTPATASSTQCMLPTSAPGGTIPIGAETYNQTINKNDGVDYSCLLIGLNNPTLSWGNIPAETSQPLVFSSSTAPGTLTVMWGTSGQTSYNNSTSFPASTVAQFITDTAWNNAGYPPVLRVTITPLNQLDRTDLLNNEFTTYLYPTKGTAGIANYTPGIGNPTSTTDGPIIAGQCANSVTTPAAPCQATISGLDLGGTYAGPYLIDITPYYGAADVIIDGISVAGSAVTFTGQATIDVTGQAHNTDKRLEATFPTNNTISTSPLDAIEAQNVCKREATMPNSTDYINPAGTTVDPPQYNDACTLSSQ